jgi:hypothetical protein
MTVAEWLAQRFRTSFGDLEVEIAREDGQPAASSDRLSELRGFDCP